MRKYRRSTSNRPAGRHDRTLPACPERPPLVHPTQHHLTAAGATEPATYWHLATHHISCRYIRAWGRQALVFTHLLLSAGSRVAQQTGTRENRRDASRATGRHASTRTERTRTRVDARELFIGELFIHCRGWSFVAFYYYYLFFSWLRHQHNNVILPLGHLLSSHLPDPSLRRCCLDNSYNPGGVWGPAGPPLGPLLYLSTYYLLCCCVAVFSRCHA